jgi:hypothetical protein
LDKTLILAHKLAGFLAAHALCFVSESKEVMATYAFVDQKKQRHIDEVPAQTLVKAVTIGCQRLAENSEAAARACFVFSGSLPIGQGEYDALILELRAYSSPSSKVILALPFSRKTASAPFKVHKMKIVEWSNCQEFDQNACLNALFKGAESQAEGGQIWRGNFDPSV